MNTITRKAATCCIQCSDYYHKKENHAGSADGSRFTLSVTNSDLCKTWIIGILVKITTIVGRSITKDGYVISSVEKMILI